MKKIAILVASVLVLGGFGTRSFAAEINTQTTQTVQPADAVVSVKEEAGVTPDSLLYIIDKAVDDLRVMLATSEEKEAAVKTEIAQERLGESVIMAEEGKTELAEKALGEYNEKITDAAEQLQQAVVSDDAVAEEADSKLEQSITDLEKAIQDVQAKSLVVLENLKGVIAEQSTDVVEDVIKEQTAHKEAVANFVAERHEFNAAKKSLNMAKVDLKKVEKSGTEAEIKAAQDKLTAAQNEYMTAKTELQTAFQAKKVADFGVKEDKAQVKTEETKTQAPAAAKEQAPAEVKAVEDSAKTAEYTKTNNSNGNGSNASNIEKEKNDKEKSAPVKSAEEQGKSDKANGKK